MCVSFPQSFAACPCHVECKKRENKQNIRYQRGCVLPTPDPARSTDRREAGGKSMCPRQDIRMDVSFFRTPQAGPSPTCLLCRKTRRKDKDVSRADRPLEPWSPSLFASLAGLWFDPERMIVMGFFFFWYADNRWQGMMQISMSGVVGSFLMVKNCICFV